MSKRLQSKAGFSLVEGMIAMVIMLLISGAVSALYFSSLHVWQRCSAQSQADPPAFIAINRITKELKNAYLVDSMGANSITFTMPATELVTIDSLPIHVNTLPLTAERQITYYLSDDTGDVGHTGTVLWRKEARLSTGQINYRKIASNVEELNFDYDAANGRVLKIYAMSVTILGREGQHRHRSQFGSHVAFRNLALE